MVGSGWRVKVGRWRGISESLSFWAEVFHLREKVTFYAIRVSHGLIPGLLHLVQAMPSRWRGTESITVQNSYFSRRGGERRWQWGQLEITTHDNARGGTREKREH